MTSTRDSNIRVPNSHEFMLQPRAVKVAAAAAHLYGALQTPGAKLGWSRCLDWHKAGTEKVTRALLFDFCIYAAYESQIWNSLIIIVTLGFCILGFFQLPLVASPAVWITLESLTILIFIVDTVAYARIRRNPFKRGWFLARIIIQMLFAADMVYRLAIDTSLVFALAIRPTYLIVRNRDIRIVLTGAVRSVANLALVAVTFVFLAWSAIYGFLIFDFCAPEYTADANSSTKYVNNLNVSVTNNSSCIANGILWNETGSNFGTFSSAFTNLLQMLTAPSYLIVLQEPYVEESHLAIVYFLVVQVFGRFVVMRIVIAVGIHTFKKMILKRQKHRVSTQMRNLRFAFELLADISKEYNAPNSHTDLNETTLRQSTRSNTVCSFEEEMEEFNERSSENIESNIEQNFVRAEDWIDVFMLMPICKLQHRRQLGTLLWNCTLKVRKKYVTLV